MPSNLTRGFPDEVHQTFPNNAFDPQNLFLAVQIHRALLQVNSHRDRGIRHARFPGVLRGQQCAAILVEGGYLSNPQEARLIEDSSYRQKLAEAVARALLSRSSSGAGPVALNSATEHDPFSTSAPGSDPDSGFQTEKPNPPTQAPTSGGSAAQVSPSQSP